MTYQTSPPESRPGGWLRQRGILLSLLAVVLIFAYAKHRDSRASSVQTDTSMTTDAHADREAFQADLDSLRARFGFPGATAAYAWADGRSGTAATGWADVEAGIPMTPTSRMLAASIGKTFVGATAAALADEGALDLEAPIATWLGDRPWFDRLPNHDTIRLRHLLTHTSGLPDHVYSDEFAAELSRQWQEEGAPFTPEDLVHFVLDTPPLFDAGEGWSYSDTGFILAGMIIEEATHLAYYEIIDERFLGPLELRLTSRSDSRDLPGLAAGYAAENALGFPSKTTTADGTMAWHPGIEWTGGGLVSTSEDLARWGAALFGGDALSSGARELMLTAEPIDPDMPEIHYGMGVAVYRASPNGTVYGHGGWIPGYTSSLRYYEEYGVAIAFQINTDIGLMDDTSSVVSIMEARLVDIVTNHEVTPVY